MKTDLYVEQLLQKYLEDKNLKNIKIQLEKPKNKEFGDLSANIALQLASQLKSNPRIIADDIKTNLEFDNNIIEKIEIAGPGFINFYIATASIQYSINLILDKKEEFGKSNIGNNLKTQVEFISANPTGPLTIGHGRQAVLGDTIARLYEACGFDVTREYYFNNAGRQMRILGESVRFRYLELLGETKKFPDDYYQGTYIIDIAKEIKKEYGDKLKNEDDITIFKNKAEASVFDDIKKTISRLKFNMDVFYNEKSLYDVGKIEEVIDLLKNKSLIIEKEGATWFQTSKLGKDQDRVLIKSTGEPTYRLPDIAYHREKLNRGFELIIDIFGADHIATYPDVILALQEMGYDTEKIKVLIHQFVTLMEDGKKVKMSTRKANFVTLDELMDEVGENVTRFFFLMRHMNSHLNFDLQLAKTQSDENPVYYVQYAHARICSIIRVGKDQNICLQGNPPFELLEKEEETNLIKHLIELPEVVKNSAINNEPHRMTNYMVETATLFHKFYTECRVIVDDISITQARLGLCEATKTVIANCCNIIGISAPERM